LNTTHNVEVQTDKSALYLIKQDKTIDNDIKRSSNQIINNKELPNDKQIQFLDNSNSKYQQNEFENTKQTQNYEHEKISEKLSANINNSQAYNEYIETDLDQPMDYTLCYDETNLDEEKKRNTTFFPKNGIINNINNNV
jgi:hypothetical protein